MPAEIVECPSCQARLRIETEARGQQMRCPGCQSIFSTSSAAPCIPPVPKTRITSTIEDYDPGDRKPAPPPRDRVEGPRRPRRREEEPPRLHRPKPMQSSRAWIPLLIAGSVLTVILIILGVTGVASSWFRPSRIDAEDWRKFEPPGARCDILMPGEPQLIQQPVPEAGVMNLYQVRTFGPMAEFGLAHMAIPQAGGFIDPEMAFREFREGMLAEIPFAEVEQERHIMKDGNAGKEYVFEIPGGTAVVQIYIVGNERLYMLVVAGGGFDKENPDVNKFLDSFTLHWDQ